MAYHKFSATELFTGSGLFSDRRVLITDEEGTVQAIVPLAEAGSNVQHVDGLLAPGFVNCHCHLELSYMKGAIPENTGMVNFVYAVLQKRTAPDREVYSAIEQAESSMLQNGIVGVGDICNTVFTLRQKSSGHLFYHNFIEVAGFPPAVADERFARGVEIFNAFAQQYAVPVESNSLVPHAPYSVSPALLERLINFPGNHLLTMHNQESAAEQHFFLDKTGDFTGLYARLGIDTSFFQPPGHSGLLEVLPAIKGNQSIILVHNVHTGEAEIAAVQRLPITAYFCLCPNANLYIGNGLPNVALLLQSGVPLVIGTDSLASNHALDVLGELKTLQHHFPNLPLIELLQWATINGARALQLDEILGSFEPGKQPGVLQIHGIEAGQLGAASVTRLV